MTEATAILSPNRENQRMLRHRSAVMTLARMHAKKSVLHVSLSQTQSDWPEATNRLKSSAR